MKFYTFRTYHLHSRKFTAIIYYTNDKMAIERKIKVQKAIQASEATK